MQKIQNKIDTQESLEQQLEHEVTRLQNQKKFEESKFQINVDKNLSVLNDKCKEIYNQLEEKFQNEKNKLIEIEKTINDNLKILNEIKQESKTLIKLLPYNIDQFEIKRNFEKIIFKYKTLKKNPLIKQNPYFCSFYYIFSNKQNQNIDLAHISKNQKEPIFILIGDINKIFIYRVISQTWEEKNINLSTYFINYNCQITFINDQELMITGGQGEASVFLLNLEKQKIDPKPPMSKPRNNHQIIFHQSLYVLGGIDQKNKNCISECEKFDMNSNSWIQLESMNFKRQSFGSVLMNNDEIYVIGGNDGQNALIYIEIYSISKNQWEIQKTKLPANLFVCKCFKIDNHKILIVENLQTKFVPETNQIRAYIFSTNTKKISQINLPQNNMKYFDQFGCNNDNLYIFNGNKQVSSKYNLLKKKWQNLKQYEELEKQNIKKWAICSKSNYQFKKVIFGKDQQILDEQNNIYFSFEQNHAYTGNLTPSYLQSSVSLEQIEQDELLEQSQYSQDPILYYENEEDNHIYFSSYYSHSDNLSALSMNDSLYLNQLSQQKLISRNNK